MFKDPTFINKLNGLLRAAAPVVVTIVVMSGLLPQEVAGPIVDSVIIGATTVGAMIWSWFSNKAPVKGKK